MTAISSEGLPPPLPPFALAAVGALAAFDLGLHWATNALTAFGVHRDEFLYLAAGRHLHVWRMDFPPGIAVLARLQHAVLGDSLFAIRAASGVAGAIVVVLAALIARELGGGRFAQCFAAFAIVANPLFLRAADLFQPVVFDQLCWTLGLYCLVRLARADAIANTAGGSAEQEARSVGAQWWIVIGVVCGIGLLWKFTELTLVWGIVAALLLTSRGEWLATKWPWVALLLTCAIGSPSIVGQVRLHYPLIGQFHELSRSQLAHSSPMTWVDDMIVLGPTILLAIAGALALVLGRAFAPFRIVGLTCIIAFATIFALHGKHYYAAPVYPTLFAAGAVWLERVSDGRFGWSIRATGTAAILFYMIIALPLSIPILAPDSLVRYAAKVGLSAAERTNSGTRLSLPQDFADMLGWPEQVAAVAAVYRALPAEQQAQVVIVGGNYGEAGAIDFYGPRYHLPPAICTQGSYYLFGPGTRPGVVTISLGPDSAALSGMFDSVRRVGRVVNPLGVAEEQDVPIWLAESPHRSWQDEWPSLAGRC